MGPLGQSTPPTRATWGRSTCSRRRSPPTTPSSPSSTSTSAPRAVAADGEVDGDHDAARRDPGRGDRRPADRRLAAGDGRRLRDPRLRRHPPRPGRDRARSSSPTARSTDPEAAEAAAGALAEPVAYEVTRLLHDNITEGTGTAAYTGCAGQAGKTGTTDEYTDAWFAGYQPNLATAVWVGYPESNDDLDDQRARDHRLRRHLPGRNLALALLRRRRPLRGIRANRSKPISWAPFYGRFTRGEPERRLAASAAPAAAAAKPPPPGSAAVGGYDPNAYAPGAGQEPCAAARRRRPQPSAAGRRRRLRRQRVASDRPRARLRPDLGRLRSPTSASSPRRRGSGARVVWGAIVAPRRRLRGRARPALPRRLQLRRLRPARRRPRPRPLRPPAARRARRPGLRRRHLDRSDQRLRAALHPRHLPARLAAGRRSRSRC